MRGSDNQKINLFMVFFYFFRATKGKPVCIRGSVVWHHMITPQINRSGNVRENILINERPHPASSERYNKMISPGQSSGLGSMQGPYNSSHSSKNDVEDHHVTKRVKSGKKKWCKLIVMLVAADIHAMPEIYSVLRTRLEDDPKSKEWMHRPFSAGRVG